MSMRSKAFTLIELALVIATLALLVLVVILGLAANKGKSLRLKCCDNLKQVGLSYRTWTMDSSDRYPQAVEVRYGGSKELLEAGQLSRHFTTMSNELSTPKVLVCPADREKEPAESFQWGFSITNISYFASQDAAEQYPQTILSGDRNLALAGKSVSSGMLVLTTNSLLPLSWTKTVHDSKGLFGLADGSVQLIDQQKLPAIVQNQDLETNRLVMP